MPSSCRRAEPARDVLLDLDDGRTRRPQADVPVDGEREQVAERRREQPPPGDVRQVTRAEGSYACSQPRARRPEPPRTAHRLLAASSGAGAPVGFRPRRWRPSASRPWMKSITYTRAASPISRICSRARVQRVHPAHATYQGARVAGAIRSITHEPEADLARRDLRCGTLDQVIASRRRREASATSSTASSNASALRFEGAR